VIREKKKVEVESVKIENHRWAVDGKERFEDLRERRSGR